MNRREADQIIDDFCAAMKRRDDTSAFEPVPGSLFIGHSRLEHECPNVIARSIGDFAKSMDISAHTGAHRIPAEDVTATGLLAALAWAKITNHPVIDPPEPKFKIGDKVEYTGILVEETCRYGTVVDVHTMNAEVMFQIDGINRFALIDLKSLKPYEEPKFKIGDRVIDLGLVCTTPRNPFGTVIRYHSSSRTVDFLADDGAEYIGFDVDGLAPYHEPKYKVGDEVEWGALPKNRIVAVIPDKGSDGQLVWNYAMSSLTWPEEHVHLAA